MKIANRMIVFAAGVIAFGAVAFGQTRMTAEIPFAFHTVRGILPAGTYELRELAGNAHLVVLRNSATQQSAFAGNAMFNTWRTAANGVVVEFACVEHNCSLKAIRTGASSLEYAVPRNAKDGDKVAVISIGLKPLNTD